MSFALNDDQILLKEAAIGFYGDKAPISAFRKLRDAGKTHEQDLWDDIGAMGFCGALIGEDHGGTAMGYRALSLILEAEATQLTQSALFQSGWLASQAIYMFGDTSAHDAYLPKIASGELACAIAWEESAHHKTSGFACTYADGKITGTKRFVSGALQGDMFLVSVTLPDGSTGLAILEATCPQISIIPLDSVDSTDLAHVVFHHAPCVLLGGKGQTQAIVDGWLDVARMGICAQMLGVTQAAFDMTLEYLKTRTQFGQVIGSFQALQHRASAMMVEMELSRSCVLAGFEALRLASVGELSGDKLAIAVSLAKARAGDTMHLVTNEMIQMHGGIGMTDAHDAGFYLKRARVLEAMYGSSAFHRDRYGVLNGY